MKNLALIAALAMSIHATDRKACIEVTKTGTNKVRFIDDMGKKHTLTLANLSEDAPEALLEIRATAGQLANKEVYIETADKRLINIGVVDSICVRKSRSTVVLN
jgi:hypothetical protein